MRKKPASVHEALQKTATYKKRPSIPALIAHRFPEWTHLEIRSYYQYYMTKVNRGNPRSFKRFRAFVFIFLVDASGNTHAKPIRVLHKSRMNESQFVAFAKSLTEDEYRLNEALKKFMN